MRDEWRLSAAGLIHLHDITPKDGKNQSLVRPASLPLAPVRLLPIRKDPLSAMGHSPQYPDAGIACLRPSQREGDVSCLWFVEGRRSAQDTGLNSRSQPVTENR